MCVFIATALKRTLIESLAVYIKRIAGAVYVAAEGEFTLGSGLGVQIVHTVGETEPPAFCPMGIRNGAIAIPKAEPV